MIADPKVAATLQALARALGPLGCRWAVIGGCALQAHGVPRDTVGVDVLADERARARGEAISGARLRLASSSLELRMLAEARPMPCNGVTVPVPPLGAILLGQLAAGTTRHLGAIEQAAEHLRSPAVDEALAWADASGLEGGARLRQVVTSARQRRRPRRTASLPPRTPR